MSVDIVIAGMPYVEGGEPLMAPGYLKSIVEIEGFSAIGIDLNVEFVNRIKGNRYYNELIGFATHGTITTQDEANKKNAIEEIIKEVDHQAQRILSYNPKQIGLSLLTAFAQGYTRWLCVRLKQLAPDIPIVVGGSGIRENLCDRGSYFCTELLSYNLIDHFITGDGERAIIEYLKGNYNYPGIDSMDWQQPDNLSDFPYPNYDDYDFSLYETPSIPILDSQGCVRKCEFCDIIEYWKKFTYKESSYTFQEMLHQSKKYNVYNFSMRNSLTNGNMREFKKWVSLVAEHNRTQPADTQVSWQGYFIIRNNEQHPEDMWPEIRDSNGTLYLGVETAIEKVRWEMGKKFKNEDIDYHLEMGKKYDVPLVMLMMGSNLGETREDYKFTQQWLQDRYQYAGKSVIGVWYTLAGILPNTAWDRKTDDDSISKSKHPYLWHETLGITEDERRLNLHVLIETAKPFNNFDSAISKTVNEMQSNLGDLIYDVTE